MKPVKARPSFLQHTLVLILAITTATRAGNERTEFSGKQRSHWAFQPVARVAEPKVQHPGWIKTPVDAFVLAKLEAAGINPSVAASKEALLRRVTFDLIGLPPTIEELRSFLADNSPEDFATVVDRLLRSPHFGERWGRHWLDTARYSDTTGQTGENRNEGYLYAHAWAYRDYVINAFNDDKPYDQFIIEQIAADKIPHSDDSPTLAALDFLTLGERFQNKNDIINDRIDTVTKGFLGLTVSCSRCHDHKFDPIPTADYYSLHGIFASSIEPVDRPLITLAKDKSVYADYAAKLRALEEHNRDIYYEALERVNGWLRKNAAAFLMRTLSREGEHFSEPGMTTRTGRSMQMQASTGAGDERIALAMLTHARPSDAVWGPWLLFSKLTPDELARKGTVYAAEVASNPGSANEYGWNPIIAAQFKDATPATLADVAAIYGAAFKLADARASEYLAAKRQATSAQIPGFDPAMTELIEMPMAVLPGGTLTTERLRDAVARAPRGLRTSEAFAFDAINQLDISHPGAPARAMVLEDAPVPADSPVLIRGQAKVRGEIVPRRFLEILSGPDRPAFKDGSGRLELARAIASKNNPLTARVLVNRVWMHLFGEGFVPTPDDLGVQSEKPMNPELLDWLATYVMDNGWSQKKLIRLIVLSNTYRQASDENPKYSQMDAHNRLLWRANIRRLDFEAIRDALLVFSGRLDPTLGGKPVNLTDEPYSFRRSVYGYVDRGNLPELMQFFDFSDPHMPNSKRATTVVPQQALFLMNSPMVVDVARKMVARKEFTGAADDTQRIAALYSICFQRAPRPEEIKLGRTYLSLAGVTNPSLPTESRRRGGSDSGTAAVKNEGERVDRSPLTPWERYAQALLFTNELIYVN